MRKTKAGINLSFPLQATFQSTLGRDPLRRSRLLRLFLVIILSGFTSQSCKWIRSSPTVANSFEDLVQEVITEDTTKVEVKWHNAREKLNSASPNEVKRWLEAQQLILTGKIVKKSYGPMQQVAIQEFWFHLEYAEPYKPWLRDCLKKEVFKDPFVNRYIHEILQDGKN